MRKYDTVEAMVAAFSKAGWDKPEFDEVRPGGKDYESLTSGALGYFYDRYVRDGGKFFKMRGNGNVYDDRGKIVFYRLPSAQIQEGVSRC